MRAARAVTAAGSTLAAASLGLTLANLRDVRVPPASPPPVTEDVAVLVPARDEADRIGPCLDALRAALDATPLAGAGRVRVVVLDDRSGDATADVVRAAARDDPRVGLLDGAPTPPGWLAKPWACHQLAAAAPEASVYVFLDADVVVDPPAVAAAVAMLRTGRLDLVSPYPRQIAHGPAERLIQPLLQWSWFSTLPLRAAERSARPSLSAANGQFLVVDAAGHRRRGGHAAVRAAVLDDLALVRAVKRHGGRGVVADGTTLAACRMYEGARAVRDGYAKSLWAAFGSPTGAVAVLAALAVTHLVPPLAALRGSRVGLAGTVAAVASRVVVARRTRSRPLDALAHPLSVLAVAGLTVDSLVRHRAGTLRWRGGTVDPGTVDPGAVDPGTVDPGTAAA